MVEARNESNHYRSAEDKEESFILPHDVSSDAFVDYSPDARESSRSPGGSDAAIGGPYNEDGEVRIWYIQCAS